MSDSELKPCPFCGSKAQKSDPEIDFPYVYCTNNLCGVKLRAYKTMPVSRWNTRAAAELARTPIEDSKS